ncbi:MAG TPA: aminoglycoside phosphotransferase family protein [Polyangiaceae bacterium]|nr:aminoglycoside phosphotransferase family protein [Polyangiaceae bacterium]
MGRAWLACLPGRVSELMQRWSLRFDAEQGGALATCSFVAFVRRADGTPAALKLGLPHMEAEHELAGLRFWQGRPVVRVLESDGHALLLERCEPGTPLSTRSDLEQDCVIATLLRQLWAAAPAAPHPFRPLLEMARYWTDAALERQQLWPDVGLARAGIERFLWLAQPRASDVLLATDLHAGNVLAARREPWLLIDPKPFVGDAAYDATQHLLNGPRRLAGDPSGIVTSFSDRLEVSAERVQSWLFARLTSSARVGSQVMGLGAVEALALARRLEKAVF